MQYHPDVNKDPSATTKMSEINEAYNTLSDPDKRGKYDQFGEAGLNSDQFTGSYPGSYGQGGGFSDFFTGTQNSSFFEDLLGNFFGGSASSASQQNSSESRKGNDIFFETSITLEEAISGKKISVQLERFEACAECSGSGAKKGSSPKTCPQCNGSGQVSTVQNTILGAFRSVATCPKCQGRGQIIEDPCEPCKGSGRKKNSKRIDLDIPPGMSDDVKIRYRGFGNAGYQGGSTGDLILRIRLKAHPLFERKGSDLYYTATISFPEAVMGTSITIPSLYGDEVLKINPGTESGSTFVLKGKGLPMPQQNKRKGQLVVTVKTSIPAFNKLDKDSQKLIKELSDKLKKPV
jgi:molecular chaperone DnaJ